MKNVDVKREGNQLIITIDLSQDLGLSKSEKTRIVATTSGNKAVANLDGTTSGQVFLGLNLYKYVR